MNAKELRQLFLDFFRENGHAIIGGASLIPENDPSVLFTTAGMHPLVPFLLGELHPAGNRLADYQKCLRTGDIAEVGDDTHLTFFEMLGNWSLNDYWKQESIQLSYEFLTERLGLEPDRLYVTCFAGDEDAPRDLESAKIWNEIGIPNKRIVFLPKSDNWWGPAGATGPCGPDSEIFYDVDPDGPEGENPGNSSDRFWEVWNNVFMEYEKHSDGSYTRLKRQNVDTGLGLERTLAVVQRAQSLYDTELFVPIMEHINSLAEKPDIFSTRVIADHIRAASFILSEEIPPGNTDQPYIVRRLIRRAVRYGKNIGMPKAFMANLGEVTIASLVHLYPELEHSRGFILSALDEEEGKFRNTIEQGEAQFHKEIQDIRRQGADTVPGEVVFNLYTTFGFPPELVEELADQANLQVDMDGYHQKFEEHQELSRQGAVGRFKGGLSERSETTISLHTATHLLHQALRDVLGDHVEQKGSNITTERLRFDFSHPEKMTKDQIAQVERIVNEQIQNDLLVTWQELSLEKAKATGAIGLFEDKYGDTVKVYSIGDYSHEICGGPHVTRTSELGVFRIVKEQSSSSGIRRIKAVLE